MCLLDNSSGAAISVRSFLEAAAASGMACESFTASLFDPKREVSLRGMLGSRVSDPSSLGKRFIVNRAGVKHSIFLSRSSQSRNFTQQEAAKFFAVWSHWLNENKPKVVITYGGSPYTLKMQNLAREQGAQIVFYLASAEYKQDIFYRKGDIVICPSRFLREHYIKTIGIEPRVLRTIMNKERLDFETIQNPDALRQRWKKGFVTFMTPIPQKGLSLFYALARFAAEKRPGLKFLVTEGRSSKRANAEMGFDLAHLPNVWLMANHEDVRSIYERTSILLVPSFWKEGFARSVQEAQLCGIPVLSSAQGGLPEALNRGGFLLSIPDNCLQSHTSRPDKATVMEWWQQIETLLDDEEAYIAASHRALASSEPRHPDVTSKNAVEFFKGVLESATGATPSH
jgi:hypothetical protein